MPHPLVSATATTDPRIRGDLAASPCGWFDPPHLAWLVSGAKTWRPSPPPRRRLSSQASVGLPEEGYRASEIAPARTCPDAHRTRVVPRSTCSGRRPWRPPRDRERRACCRPLGEPLSFEQQAACRRGRLRVTTILRKLRSGLVHFASSATPYRREPSPITHACMHIARLTPTGNPVSRSDQAGAGAPTF